MSVCLGLCLSVLVRVCLSWFVSVCLCLCQSVSVCLSWSVSVCLGLCQSVSVCVSLSLSLSACLGLCLSVLVCVCLSWSVTAPPPLQSPGDYRSYPREGSRFPWTHLCSNSLGENPFYPLFSFLFCQLSSPPPVIPQQREPGLR